MKKGIKIHMVITTADHSRPEIVGAFFHKSHANNLRNSRNIEIRRTQNRYSTVRNYVETVDLFMNDETERQREARLVAYDILKECNHKLARILGYK